jgi:predicted nucleic acid-binding protein
MTVMVDTGAWYALADISDANHVAADAFYRQIAGKVPFVTTDAILVETWALLVSRLGRPAALTFWQTLREAGIPLICLTERDLEAAWHIAQAFPDLDLSLTDCTTFSVMERLRIDRVFTFDRHFYAYRYGSRREKALLCEPGITPREKGRN